MITEFLSKINRSGVASSARFICMLTPPPGLKMDDDIRFSIESTEFPGQRIETKEYRSYGIPFKFAYQRSNDDISITFRCSDSMIEKTIFDNWMALIYNNKTGNVKYRSSMIGTIEIYQIGWNGQSPYAVTVDSAFPISVSELSLDWGSQSSYHKFTVSFAYGSWEPFIDTNAMFFGAGANQSGEYLPVSSRELRDIAQQNYGQTPTSFNTLASSGGAVYSPLSSQLGVQSSLLNSPAMNMYGSAQNILSNTSGSSMARNMMSGAVNSALTSSMGSVSGGVRVPSFLNGIGLPSRIGMPDIFTQGLNSNTFSTLMRVVGSTGITSKFMRNLPPTTVALLNYSLAKILGR